MSYATLVFLTAADRRYFVKIGRGSAVAPRGPEWRADRKLLEEELIRVGARWHRYLTDRGHSILADVEKAVAANHWQPMPFETKDI